MPRHKQAAVFFGTFALLEEFAVTLLDDIVTFSLLDETFAILPPLFDSATIEELLSFETTNVPLDSGEATVTPDGLSSEQATTPNNKAAAAIPRFALYTILSSITTNLIYINPLQKSIIG
jgi:hypothetical protein